MEPQLVALFTSKRASSSFLFRSQLWIHRSRWTWWERRGLWEKNRVSCISLEKHPSRWSKGSIKANRKMAATAATSQSADQSWSCQGGCEPGGALTSPGPPCGSWLRRGGRATPREDGKHTGNNALSSRPPRALCLCFCVKNLIFFWHEDWIFTSSQKHQKVTICQICFKRYILK